MMDISSEIPIIAIPVLNRGDLLRRCVESIDFPTGLLVIINNGRDESVKNAIKDIKRQKDIPFRSIWVCEPGRNLGVAASWNLGIERMLAERSPYLILVGSDIQFSRGDLERFARSYDHDIVLQCGNHAYSAFMISQKAVSEIGLFDENFYPAYLEDSDYDYRIKLAALHRPIIAGMGAIHGAYGPSGLMGSCTINSDRRLRDANDITHGRNLSYYVRKWGGVNGSEIFKYPFNNPSLPLSHWKIDPSHRQGTAIWPDS